MEFDISWYGLLNPGEGDCFFDGHGERGFQVEETGFNTINAWWLAECCRLIYRQEASETGNPEHDRRRQLFFEAVNLQETAFWHTAEGTQCALLESSANSSSPFAVLVFRGTQRLSDWNTNIRFLKSSRWPGSGRVHAGFYRALQPVWDEISAKLDAVESPIFYTGHSLGAALATLAAALRPPRAVYTFGSPRVGDEEFSASLAELPIYRVVNNRDLVAGVPQTFLNYTHAGELHYYGRNGARSVDPDVTALKNIRQLKHDADYPRKQIFSPPECFADHAPVNYVVQLEREVSGDGS